MIVTLKFDMSDEDDRSRHAVIMKADRMASALSEFRTEVRRILKYEEISEETRVKLEGLRESVMTELQEDLDI